MLSTLLRPLSVIHIAAPDRGKLVTLVAGKRRCLLFAGDGRRSVYDKKLERYAKDNTTEQSLIVWSGKSEAVKDCARDIVPLKRTRQTVSIARPLCDSRATCC